MAAEAKTAPKVGMTFHHLTITALKKVDRTKETVCECACSCGKTRDVKFALLKKGVTKSCGCMNYCSNSHGNRIYEPSESSFRAKAANYKAHAKFRNIDFSLSVAEAVTFLQGKCHYCGSEPMCSFNVRSNQKYESVNKYSYKMREDYEIKYNGLDRVDNELGYTSSNTVSCCKFCNTAKLNRSQDDFVQWIKNVCNTLKIQP